MFTYRDLTYGEVAVKIHLFLPRVLNTVRLFVLFYKPTTLTHAQRRRLLEAGWTLKPACLDALEGSHIRRK